MRRFQTNFGLLVTQLLPPHKRQEIRITVLQALTDLSGLFAAFDDWRREQSRLVNVNCQIKILEGYLRLKFDRRILIKSYDDGLVPVSLVAEGQFLAVGLLSAGEALAAFPLIGELASGFNDADFVVLVPPDVDLELLKIEIEKIKFYDKTYKIIQQ